MTERVHFFCPAARIALGLTFGATTLVPEARADADNYALGHILLGIEDADPDKEVIEADEVEARQPATLNELFATTPEISVSGGNRTAAQKVYVRGLEETNLNVTVDGAVQTGGQYRHSGNMGIDPFLLKRVEVEGGTASALSGPGALGGAIRYETKDAADLLLPGQTQGVMLRFGGQSNGNRLSTGLAVYGAPDERFSYLFYGSKQWADNYTDGRGEKVSYSGNDPLDGLVKLRFAPAEGHRIEFVNSYREDNGWRDRRMNFGLADDSETPEDQEATRRSTTLRYNYDPSDNALIDLTATIYDTENRILRKPEAGRRRGEGETRGADIRNRSALGDLTLTYGADYLRIHTRGKAEGDGWYSETGYNQGLYLQGDYEIDPHWHATAGLRYDKSWLTDLAGNDYRGDRLSPNAGLRYMPVEGLTIFASWAEAYRGIRPIPGMKLNLGAIDPDTDTGLDGEVARTTEIGVSYAGGVWRSGLSAYSTRISDYVLYGGQRGTPYKRSNGGDIELTGFTVRLGRDWGNLSGDISYNHSDTDFAGDPASPSSWGNGVAPQGDKIVLSLGYRMPRHDLRIGWTSTVVLAEDDLPESYTLSDKLPAYDVHDLSVVWRPRPNAEYSLALTNIFDEAYIDHATPPAGNAETLLYEEGRSIRLAATLRF